jgi:hypothetical protein
MKDTFEKIPGSFRKMLAKEVNEIWIMPLLYSAITCLTSGQDDADGKTGGRIKDYKYQSKTDAKSTI